MHRFSRALERCRLAVAHVQTPERMTRTYIGALQLQRQSPSDMQNLTRALFCRFRLQTGHALRHHASDWLLSEALWRQQPWHIRDCNLSCCGLRLRSERLRTEMRNLFRRGRHLMNDEAQHQQHEFPIAAVNMNRSARPSSLHLGSRTTSTTNDTCSSSGPTSPPWPSKYHHSGRIFPEKIRSKIGARSC